MYLLGKQRQEDFTFKPKLTKHVKNQFKYEKYL